MIATDWRRATFALSLALVLPVAAAAQDRPVQEAELRAHVEIMASDAFEGRAPGTEGEDRTIAYVVGEWSRAGLVSGSAGPLPWLQAVPLVETTGRSSTASFARAGRTIGIEPEDVVLTGDIADARVVDAPVLFAGYGVDAAGKVNGDVAGKIVLMLTDTPPFGDNLPRYRTRRQMVIDAGAAGVIGVPGAGVPWTALRRGATTPQMSIAGTTKTARISGSIAPSALGALLSGAGLDANQINQAAQAGDFVARDLGITATLSADTAIRRFDSHNIIGKLPGRRPDGRAVLVLGHWDHLGICRPEGVADRICNGAVDNASGIAVMIEVAERLANGPKLDRDVYFLATTAEERGLLGAYHFADNPVVPLDRIVAALNIDTIAISPRGTPVAVIGRGQADHDRLIGNTARRLGRTMDLDGEADAFVQRQDGWALAAKGVPAMMVGGSFSDMKLLQAFLAGAYHGPDDQPAAAIPLGGAAEDADLHVALVRAYADTKGWPAK